MAGERMPTWARVVLWLGFFFLVVPFIAFLLFFGGAGLLVIWVVARHG